MTRRRVILAGCLLLSASVSLAQSRGAKTDPITGTWAGELNLESSARVVAVTMALKFDGKGSVSGTVTGLPNPANVKSGTFDPKTGALKLQLGKTSDNAVLLRLEGSVVKGAAKGRFSGDESGDFKLAKKD